MKLPEIKTTYLIEFLTKLLQTPSPTGFVEPVLSLIEQELRAFPALELSRTRKGALLATWPGERNETPRALTAHADTLGAMVKEIKSNGRLKLTKLGSFAWNTVEGESCTVFTRNGRQVRGSILVTKASSHVHGNEVNEEKRTDDTMEMRLDARVAFEDDVRDLGIEVGDFVAFDARVEINAGFMRSRHLDDKACIACMVAAVKAICDAGLKPNQSTYLFFSNYEEAGHGAAAGIPPEVYELITVDMAAVGEGQSSDEFHATLCVKDSGGPYHHGLSMRLRQLAETHKIPIMVDIYPYYGSDGEAFWRAGGDVAVALIGPGVDASHNYERTHTEALLATTKWLLAYLLSD